MEILRNISIADWIIMFGGVCIMFRVCFFLLLRKRHTDIWKKLSPSSGQTGFSKINFDIKNEFLDKKEFRKIQDSQLRMMGEITNVLTTIFMWSFGIFIFYLFIWPLIKLVWSLIK